MKLGVVDPEEDILRALTYRKLRQWQHYFELEVPEEVKADYRAAMIMQIMANLWGRGKGKPAYRVSDFLPKWVIEEEKTPSTPDQLWKKLNILAAMHANDGPPPIYSPSGEIMNSAPPPIDRTPGEVDEVGLALLRAREAMIKT